MITTCKQCGELFKTNNTKRIFCSHHCYADARRKFPSWIKVKCEICGKELEVKGTRTGKFHTCSIECRSERSRRILSDKKTITCPVCKKQFEVKKSHSKRRTYCSKTCQAISYSTKYLGTCNPNFRNVRTRSGYPMMIPLPNKKSMPLHKLVVLETLNVSKLKKGLCIHHRDCQVENNLPQNLVVLNNSEHRWLHKQFGSAGLWAFCNGKISLDESCRWSNNPELARRLLPLTVIDQVPVVSEISDDQVKENDGDSQVA